MTENMGALAALQECIDQVFTMADAYRAAAIARGYSPTAAEAMTVDFHRSAWSLIVAQQAGAK